MGGPFWATKDAGAWSIPKGELLPGDEADGPAVIEDELDAARREFGEEIGIPAPVGDYVSLGEFRQSSGKVVIAFALESDLEVDAVNSNTFPLEWPPRSGRIQQFPEVDEARWFPLEEARVKLVKGQHAILDALAAHLSPW